MLESKYQRDLIKRIRSLLPGSIVLKNDANVRQGIPDLIVLWGQTWAALEVKNSFHAPFQPNQEYYLDLMGGMSWSAMICPENEKKVLGELLKYMENTDEIQHPLGA